MAETPHHKPPAERDSGPRVRYVTRGRIRNGKEVFAPGSPINPGDLPKEDFDRAVEEGVIVLDTGRK